MIDLKMISSIALFLLLISLGAEETEAGTLDTQIQIDSGEVAYLAFQVNGADPHVEVNLEVLSGPNIDIVTLDDSNLTNFQAGHYYYFIDGTARDVNFFHSNLSIYPGTFYLVIDNTYLERGVPRGRTALVHLSLNGENCTFFDPSILTQADFYTYNNRRGATSNDLGLIIYFFIAMAATLAIYGYYRKSLKKRTIPKINEPDVIDRPSEEHRENIGGPVVITICHHCGVQIPPNAQTCNRCGKRQ